MSDRIIVLDTETTGVDIKNGDRVIEIGCVEIIDWRITGEIFHVYLNPEREIAKEATRVHGMTLDQLLDKPKFLEIASTFSEFLGDDNIVAHNANFDVKFLNSELMRANQRKIIQQSQVIDTLQIARKMFPGAPASLDALCRRFKICLEQRKMHGALLDAQLLARVYLELSKGEQSSFGFDDEHVEKSEERIAYENRQFKNTEEELQSHRELVKRIKNPLWDEETSYEGES